MSEPAEATGCYPRTSSSVTSSSPNPSVPSLHTEIDFDLMESVLHENPSRRTFQLLSRIVESRVPVGMPLHDPEYWHPLSFCCQNGMMDDAAAEPSDDPSHHQAKNRGDNRTAENISDSTVAAALDLVNTFESNYTDGYKSLVSDALQVYNATTSSSTTTASSSSSSEEVELDLSPLFPLTKYHLEFMEARVRYIKILHSLFVQQINWGRIVAMMSFLRALCEVLNSPPQTQPLLEDENAQASPLVDNIDFVPLQRKTMDSSVEKTDDNPKGAMTSRKMSSLHYLVWTTEFIHKESQLGDWIENHGSWEGLESFVQAGKFSQLSSLLFGVSIFLLGPVGFASAIAFVLRRLWSR